MIFSPKDWIVKVNGWQGRKDGMEPLVLVFLRLNFCWLWNKWWVQWKQYVLGLPAPPLAVINTYSCSYNESDWTPRKCVCAKVTNMSTIPEGVGRTMGMDCMLTFPQCVQRSQWPSHTESLLAEKSVGAWGHVLLRWSSSDGLMSSLLQSGLRRKWNVACLPYLVIWSNLDSDRESMG